MLVTDDRLLAGRDPVALARAAEQGGVSAVQVRLKRAGPRAQVDLVRALVRRLAIPVLVNDRPDVALAAGAAGVHLGPADLPVRLARRIAPAGFLIGASVGSDEEAGAAEEADYWGIGPWHLTVTKGDAGEAIGPGQITLFRERSALPIVAIGGITLERIREVRDAGADSIAVVGAETAAPDPVAAAWSLSTACEKPAPQGA